MILEFLAKMRMDRFDPEYLPTFESRLFFEGERKNKQIVNFIVLLALATVIATYGVVTDSTASVIGAMIIAPLMTPIMASAAAVILGSTIRLKQALRLVVLGILGVIILSMLLTFFIPNSLIANPTNTQITSRVSPGLLDLMIALAAGACRSLYNRAARNCRFPCGCGNSHLTRPSVVCCRYFTGEWRMAGCRGSVPSVSYQLFRYPLGRGNSISPYGA